MPTDEKRLESLIRAILDEELTRFEKRINDRILTLEHEMKLLVSSPVESYSATSAGVLRPSWLKTLKLIKNEFDGRATAETLAEKIGVRKSVVSGYLSKLQELRLVKRKHNHTSMPGRYLFALTESGEETLMQTEPSVIVNQ